MFQILDSLIEEDDSVPNVWYVLAMCLLGGGQTEAAAEALQHGQKLLKKQSDADELAQDFKDLKVCTSHTFKLCRRLSYSCSLKAFISPNTYAWVTSAPTLLYTLLSPASQHGLLISNMATFLLPAVLCTQCP